MQTNEKDMPSDAKYPHRLTFLKRGSCDVCGDKGNQLVHTDANRYFGWETCNREACNKQIQSWYCDTTISQDELIKMLGERVRVQRRSGELEDDWEVSGDGHMDHESGAYWVKVKNAPRHVTKEVLLTSLVKWN